MSTPPIALRITDLFNAQCEALQLEWVSGRSAGNRTIGGEQTKGEHPALIGYLNLIRPNHIQVAGLTESHYLARQDLVADTANTRLLFQSGNDIIVFTDGQEVPAGYHALADQYQVAIMTTPLPGHELIDSLQHYIAHSLARHITLHGVFMDVLGIGVLITGDSSIGKSELALELISRGHALVADDAPQFTRIAHDTLEGSCPPLLRDFLEVRGLGILNVNKMYGDSSTRYRKIIKLIIHLETVRDGKMPTRDRLFDGQCTTPILDVPVTRITIPVAPGRNIAVLAEAGVRNYLLRKEGYNATEHIIDLQSQAMEHS